MGEGRNKRERAAIEAVAHELESAFGAPPEAVITLGSGLGPVLEQARILSEVATTELGLPESTVPGHAGKAILAELGGKRVLFLSGRVHRYEGYSMDELVRYVRAAWRWGVPRLFLSCSAGSLLPKHVPGSITRIVDHVNLMGDNPLIGGPLFEGEVRFPDASKAHDVELHEALAAAAVDCGLSLEPAIYVALSGPAYESPAEVRMLGMLGADLVGMSTVPEVLAAHALGMRVAALGVVSNFGAGVGEGEVDHDQVTEVAGKAAAKLGRVLAAVVAGF